MSRDEIRGALAAGPVSRDKPGSVFGVGGQGNGIAERITTSNGLEWWLSGIPAAQHKISRWVLAPAGSAPKHPPPARELGTIQNQATWSARLIRVGKQPFPSRLCSTRGMGCLWMCPPKRICPRGPLPLRRVSARDSRSASLPRRPPTQVPGLRSSVLAALTHRDTATRYSLYTPTIQTVPAEPSPDIQTHH